MRTRLPSPLLRTATRLILAASFSLILTLGCSKPPGNAGATPGSESPAGTAAPITNSQHSSAPTRTPDVLRIEELVGGIPTSAIAYFDATQLQRIVESRKPGGTGDYVFHGARLIEYQGTAPGSATVMALHFDSQGALVSAAAGNNPLISDSTLSSIRTRAQLLRSLALARRTTATHTSQH